MGLRKTERKLKAELSRYGTLIYEKDRAISLTEEELYCWDRLFVRNSEEVYRNLIKTFKADKKAIEKEADVVRAELKTVQDKIEKRLKIIRPILTFLAVIVMIFFQVGFWWMMSTERLSLNEDSAPGAVFFWIMMTGVLTASIGEARDFKKR